MISMALHGAVLIPLWMTCPASFDVARGSAGFEIQALLSGDAGVSSVRQATVAQGTPGGTPVLQRRLVDQALASLDMAEHVARSENGQTAQGSMPAIASLVEESGVSSMEGAGEGAASGAGAFIAARPYGTSSNQPPPYPRAARERGWEGTVLLHVRVEADGSPGHVEILASSGYDVLDHAAQAAVERWHFLPAQRAGRPLVSVVELPIRFQLTSSL